VLLRADLDVPLEKQPDGTLKVKDDFRILKSLETINWLRQQKAKTVIISHIDRPHGIQPESSLLPVAHHLSGLLDLKMVAVDKNTKKLPHYAIPHFFFFTDDISSESIKAHIADLNPGDVCLLENIRFYKEEAEAEESFIKKLASLGDIYVNDAFGVSHRSHASITGIAKLLPHYTGLHMEEEIKILQAAVKFPKKPFIVVIGGIKLSSKLDGLSGLIEKADKVLVGGGLAAEFFMAKDYNVGKSIVEKELKATTRNLFRNNKEKIILPIDVVVATDIKKTASIEVVKPENIPPDKMVLDIGPATIQEFAGHIKKAKTIVWSGPLGLFEEHSFSHGTKAIARLIASRSSGIAQGFAGGGNTVDALSEIGMIQDMDFVSSGGGAMLQYLSSGTLPGIKALE
jgi:phosphoglycerate kinase